MANTFVFDKICLISLCCHNSTPLSVRFLSDVLMIVFAAYYTQISGSQKYWEDFLHKCSHNLVCIRGC